MLNFSTNQTSSSISVDFYLVMLQDSISILIRSLIWLGMIRCRRQCYPFEVTCIVTACFSYNTAIALWLIESCLKNIDLFRLPCSLHFTCYVITARQVFWILNNHCLVFLALHRVYVVHQSVINTQFMPKRGSLGYKPSIAVHLIDAFLILLLHLSTYITHSLEYTDFEKCSRRTKPSFAYYEKSVLFLKSFIPCTVLFVSYVIIIPVYLKWSLTRGKMNDRTRSHRVKRAVRLTIKFFVYTFLQILAWCMAAAINEFVVKKYAVKEKSRHLRAAFEVAFGTLVDERTSGIWWMEAITWFYCFLDGYNPIVFIFMHKHLLEAIKSIILFRNKSF